MDLIALSVCRAERLRDSEMEKRKQRETYSQCECD